MGRYVLSAGSRTGQQVVDADTGETVVASGRTLDNMTPAAAQEAAATLERRDAVRRSRLEGAEERNDLIAILDNAARDD